jgi:membrane protein DedA with SNARE-associated domain
LDEFLRTLSTLDPVWVYAAICFVAFLENVFPPAPSDVIVVFGGALAAMDRGNFILALLAGTIGSTVGFVVMFLVGKWFGRRILETGRLKFVNLNTVHKLERWFVKYGYWLIIGNRFLSGTRAVVAFFAGISELHFGTTTFLSFVSSLCWYGILVYAGYSLGDHWEKVGGYLRSYGEVMTAVVCLVILAFVVRYVIARRRANGHHG